MTPIILNNQGYTSYPNGTAGDPLRAVEFRVMLRGADAPPVGSGPFRITVEPQPPPVSPGGHSGPAEPPSPAQESSGPETAAGAAAGGRTRRKERRQPMSGLKIPELIQAIRRRCAAQYAEQNQAETQMRQAMIGNDQRGFDEAAGRQQLAQLTGSILGNIGMALEEAWKVSHDDADGPEVEETDEGEGRPVQ